MPSDQDENRVVWQQNVSAMEEELPALAPAMIADQSIDNVSMEEAIDMDDLLEPDTDSDLLQWESPPLFSKETLRTLGRQLSPLLVPLPFALLVFLFTFPATLQSPPAHLSMPITGILLLAVAILQGMLLYFAGSNDTLWILYITAGYALFILCGVLAAFGVGAMVVTLVIFLLLGGILAQRCIHPTRVGYVDIVESAGKYAHTFYPGLNLLMPWEKVVQRLNTQEICWNCPMLRVPISRDHHVQLTATISYQLLPEDAHLVALAVRNWEASLQALFVGTVQSLVNDLTPSDFVTWSQSNYTTGNGDAGFFNPTAATRWDRINTALNRRVQDQVASWGVQINWIRIQDVTLLPNAPGGHSVPIVASNTGGTTQIMKSEPAPAQTPVAPTNPAKTEVAKDPLILPAPPTPKSEPAPPVKAPSIEILKDMYNAVRSGKITDPVVILDIARRFEDLANDPVASKNIDFDASRAAGTLRARAQKFQELAQTNSKQA